MPLYWWWNPNKRKYKYKVFAVDTIEQDLLDEMWNDGREIDYAVQRPDKIYLIFRKYMYEDS